MSKIQFRKTLLFIRQVFTMVIMNKKFAILMMIAIITSGFSIVCSNSYLDSEANSGTNNARECTQFRASSYTNTTSGVVNIDLNNTEYVNVPKNGTVVEAKLNISTTDNFPKDVSLDIGNNSILGSFEWKYSGNGYGSFGLQEEFSDNSTNKTFEFLTLDNVTSSVYLPKDASIINASARISGKELSANFSRKDETTSEFENGTMTNVSSLNDKLNLTMKQTTWNQTSETDFSLGLYENVTLNDPSGDVRLAYKADWYSTNWQYRCPIYVKNYNAQALTHYQTRISIDTRTLIANSQMREDCNDMRFTSADGTTLLNHWIESGRNTSDTVVWVKIPSLVASGDTKIYMYYGNPSAANTSNAANTFYLYEDFEGTDTWTFATDANADFTHAINTTPVHSPTHSHRIYFKKDNTPQNKYGQISKTITLPDTGQLRIIFNYYSTNTQGTGYVNKSVFLGSTQLWSEDTYTNRNAWHENEVTVTPATTSINLILRLFNFASNPSSMSWNIGCYWDDIIVRKYAATEPLISFGTPEGMYVSSGRFYSTVSGNVTNAAVRFTTITWDASVISSQNILLLQTRTGNTTNPDDGTWSSWSAAYTMPGSTITSPPGKYIQYYVALATVDTTKTPVLRSVEIGLERYELEGTYISSFINATVAETIVSAKANVSMLIYANSSVKISLSNDGGTTWLGASDGEFVNFSTNGTSLLYRLDFSSDGGTSTVVDNITIEYTILSKCRNVTLDFGNNGVNFTKISGILEGNVTINITGDIAHALQSQTSAMIDDFGNRICSIPLSLGSETLGIVSVLNLSIYYSYTAKVLETLVCNSIQAYVNEHQNESFYHSGLEFVSVPLTFSASKSGSVFYELYLVCDMPPEYTSPIPIIYMYEDTDLPNALDLTNFFRDDFNFLYFNITYQECPSFVYATLEGSNLSLDALFPNWYGTTNITVSASDRFNKTVYANVTIVVLPLNDAPVISLSGTFSTYLGIPIVIDFSNNVSDIDNNTSELSIYTNLSEALGETIHDGLVISFNFTTPGEHVVRVFVTDGLDETYTDLNFLVLINQPPVISPAIDDFAIFSNETITLDLATHVFDSEGETVSWNATAQVNGSLFIITLNGTNLTITPQECANGTANITITASDSFGNSATFTFNLTVYSSCNLDNHPPQLFPFSDICLLSNETEIVSVNAHGLDTDGDLLSWYVTETSDLFDIVFDGTNITILPFECANGTGLVFVYLSDGLVNVSTSFEVVVISNCSGGNRPPTITNIPEVISILSNQTFNLDLKGHGFDADGDSLTWFANETSSLIDISLSNDILMIVPTECANGTAFVYLRLSDDKGAFRTAQIEVRITNACIAEHIPPRIKPIPDQIIEGNNVITILLADYEILGTDKNPNWYLVSFDENVVKILLNYTTKTITISRVSTSSAHSTVNLKLVDSLGYVSETSFNVIVKEIKNGPKPGKGDENQFCLLFGIIAIIAALIVVFYFISRRKNVVKVTMIETEPAVSPVVNPLQTPQQLQTNVAPPPITQATMPTIQTITQPTIEQKEKIVDMPQESAIAKAKAVTVESAEVKVARPVATAIEVETDEEVAVAKTVFSTKGKKGKKGKNVDAMRREYEEIESRITKLSKSKNAQEKEKYENALRLAGTYAKAGNFEKAISILKKAEGK